MERVEHLVVGAGISGLSFANWLRAACARRGRPEPQIQVVEADASPGGYCKTVVQDGYVWDYSGHFFHFKEPEIEAWLRARMPGQEVRTVAKRSYILYKEQLIDFPFQKNIHQLPRDEFIDCLFELYEASTAPSAAPRSFRDMLYRRLGRGIAERFLIPYNEKLYACDLDRLDVDAMGRFFPHAQLGDIIRNMRHPDNDSYNASFTYPRGGAIQYVEALLRELPVGTVVCGEPVQRIDLRRQVAITDRREISYRHLISSAPFHRLLQMSGLAHDPAAFSWNKVLVFNLGFDRKGASEPHWIYVPERDYVFYRVGYYDNILGSDRMSLYVEIGAERDAELDIPALRQRVLSDLARAGIVTEQQLVSWHSVVLDPAYVHITRASLAEHARLGAILNTAGVYPVGRYGGWTYCSIEDNMLETRALAARLAEIS
jgi:protoporphyrinogen oxidase